MPRRPRAILLGGKIPFSIFNGCTSMIRTHLSFNHNNAAPAATSVEESRRVAHFVGGLALEAGAAGLTVHPRPDERHIRRTDLAPLKALVEAYPGREFNIEGNPFENLMPILKEIRPHQATFVPDAADQKTSDHGFEFNNPEVREKLAAVVAEAQSYGCRVSLFMDHEPEFTRWAKETGADCSPMLTVRFYAMSLRSASMPVTTCRLIISRSSSRPAATLRKCQSVMR